MDPAAVPANPPAAAADASAGRIVIAGVGLLTPLGHSAWETFRALLAGRTLADRAGNLPADVAAVDLVRALGAVSLAQHTADDPAVELADRAAREAAFAAGVPLAGVPTFLGTSKGAVAALTRATEALLDQPSATASPAAPPPARTPRGPGTDDTLTAVAAGPHDYLTQRLARRLDLEPVRHVVAACASSLTALHHAREHLRHAPRHRDHDGSELALVLTAEAALLPSFIHSYRRLGVLAPLDPANYRQRPLDAARGGFMLTECGAAVLLRRLPPGVAPQPGQIELIDTAIAAEAYDLIRPSPDMPALRRVADQLAAHGPVEMLHPHAPGTADHDPAELAAYETFRVSRFAFRVESARATSGASSTRNSKRETRNSGNAPDLYACKGALGHALGAAGLQALVLACLCLQAGRRPPMPWLTDPIVDVSAAATPTPRRGRHAVFAAGFAGHVAGALIQRH